MTIYSQHASRGKIQILATYRGPGGVMSSTVTSLGSALATVPLSVFDLRGRKVQSYPTGHVRALTEPATRSALLAGVHSLWYAYVCFELRQALADLEDALAPVPEPVRIAVQAEVEKEARLLSLAAPDDEEPRSDAEEGGERVWSLGEPFVLYEGGMDVLSAEVREKLNEFEVFATDEERVEAVADLRVVLAAEAQCSDLHVHVEPGYLDLSYDPFRKDRLFVTVSVPRPGEDDDVDGAWWIDISQWVPDDPDEDEEDFGSATGYSKVRCELPARPSVQAIVDLVRRLDTEPHLLGHIVEAATVGSPLGGTPFVVTALGED